MLTIRTNHVPREILDGFMLTVEERKEFDYLTEDEIVCSNRFFRFKGNVYDIQEFMSVTPQMLPEFQSWHGYSPDSAWSGVVIHLSGNGETVIVGQYFS
jgi:hypothetical protein